jgi:hypothetical protein
MGLFLRLLERHRAHEARQDRRAGEVAVAIYNDLKRDPAKAPEPWTWEDIFPQRAPPEPEEQDEEEMLRRMDRWARRHPNPAPN